MKQALLAMMIGAVAGLPLLASAQQVYKWVDADGTVHFSESPPPGTEADEMKLRYQSTPDPEAAAAQHKAWNDAYQERRDSKQEAAEQSRVAAQEAAERRQKCEQARGIIDRLTTAPATRYKREDGSYQRYGDAEREQKIATAREAEREFCY